MNFQDEGTKFFHANATIKHNRNLITAIKDGEGNTVTSHEAKENIIWSSFKERLGQSQFQQMFFDLNTILTPNDSLVGLQTPFTEEEIDEVVANAFG